MPYSTIRALTSSLLRPLMTEVDSRLKTSSGGMTCHSRPASSACALVMASWGNFVSFRPLLLDSSMPKELIGGQNTSETLEVSTYTVRNWTGSIVPGSVEFLLEFVLFIDCRELEALFTDSRELAACVFVTGWLLMLRASSSTACQRTPSFCLSPSDSSILKFRGQEKTTLWNEPRWHVR